MSQTKDQVLSHLHALVGSELDTTNRIIIEKLDAQVALIPAMGQHLIQSGGKRLRPILTLLTSKMFGYQGEAGALLASVIEFIHTATLLHDDVVDMSTTRRGQATANSLWGSKAPVLVGDFLFSRSFQILVQHGDLQVLKIIADACAIISEGEVLQLVVSKDLNITEKQYFDVVTGKTATLFAAATRTGGVVAECSPEEERRLGQYGLNLGMAYQVVDDALDYSANQETLGKSIGDDFNEGKITLPVIHAYANATPEEKAFWQSCEKKENRTPENLQKAIAIVKERGSLDYAMDRAKTMISAAKEALAPLPDGPEKEAMLTLADFSVDRNY